MSHSPLIGVVVTMPVLSLNVSMLQVCNTENMGKGLGNEVNYISFQMGVGGGGGGGDSTS